MVLRVIDGDTIEVRLANGDRERVRYIGIDAWEMSERPHGDHGLTANRELVSGKDVRLVRDRTDRDRFGRLLRYVYVGGRHVNAELIKAGRAKAKNYPPDEKFKTRFSKLETQARRLGRGCWAEQAVESADALFVGNRNGRKLHDLDHDECRQAVGKMSRTNKVFFGTESEAEAAGYALCGLCGE